MPPQITPAGKYILELLTKFPTATTRTLASKAYKEHPTLWKTQENCRGMIRNYRGQNGEKGRKQFTVKEHFQKGTCTGFAPLPEPIEEIEDWKTEFIDIPGLWLKIADPHIPWHNLPALEIVLKRAKERKVKGILLNGDIIDCFAISHWQKDPRKRDFPFEVKSLRQFFESLRKRFPKIPLIWKWGNHEERFENYMQIKAPELLGIPEFEFENISGANEYGIQVVKDMRPIKLGKLYILHGHEYRFAIANPVNPARGLYLRAKVSAICDHFHQTSQHSEPDLAGHLTTCWSSGCLCNLHPRYMPLNKWNIGAAFAEISNDGAYSVDNFRIIDGKVW